MARDRLTVDVTPRQKLFLDSLPFGWKQHLFSALIDMIMDMVHRCGRETLGAIVAKRIKLEEYFLKKERDNAKKTTERFRR